MKNIVDLLLDNFGQDRVKTTPDFLEKYGRDWYEGYDPCLLYTSPSPRDGW